MSAPIFQLVIVSRSGTAVPIRTRVAGGPAWYDTLEAAQAGARIENAARRARRTGLARVSHVGAYHAGRRLSLEPTRRTS